MSFQDLLPTERHNLRARAEAIYEAIKDELDPGLKGKVVAIEAESGDYFTGDSVLDAAQNARGKHPNKTFHFFRVGSPTVYVWR